MNEEEAYKKELEEAGVDVSEIQTETPKETDTTTETQEPKVETVETETTEPIDTEPKEAPKRSIYDEYKEKKLEARSEKERADIAERERDELKSKLEAFNNADTPKERIVASNNLEAFAEKIGADPETLKEMREMFLKDVTPQTDPAIAEKLAKFEAWQSQNAHIIEKTKFEEEFKAVVPSIKEMFPTSSEQEIEAIKAKVDELSHTEAFHDKELDYVLFKNKSDLGKLVSPKKRGMETKERKDVNTDTYEFDINADYSQMTLKERELWEEGYRKATSEGQGIKKDGNGRTLLI